MATINSPHPERGKDEIFIAIVNRAGWEEIGWRSKRKGSVCPDDSGNHNPRDPVFPVFANRAELAERGLVFN